MSDFQMFHPKVCIACVTKKIMKYLAIREIVRITICASAPCTNHLVPPHFDVKRVCHFDTSSILKPLASLDHALWLRFLRSLVDTAVGVDVSRNRLIGLCTLGGGLCVVTYLLGIVIVDGSKCEEN